LTPLDLLRKAKIEWKSLNGAPNDTDFNTCEEYLNNAIEKSKKNNS